MSVEVGRQQASSAQLARVQHWAKALIALYLDDGWSFAFDNARTRAGLCRHGEKKISVSRHAVAAYSDDEIHQVLLHEVAHAIAGPKEAHGPKWKAISREIGYDGSRLAPGIGAAQLARWVGSCPAGHVFYRHRRPSRELSCATCSKKFNPLHAIRWEDRDAR